MTEAGECTIKGLSGRGLPGNKGLLDLVLYQWQLRTHLLNETLAALMVSPASKSKLRSAFSSYKSFEAECRNTESIAWIGVLEKPAQLFQKMVQSCCFLSEYDPQIKRCIRSQQNIVEMLTEPPFDQMLSNITEAASAGTAAGSAARCSQQQNDAKMSEEEDDDDDANHTIALCTNLATNKPDDDAHAKFKSLKKENKKKIKEFEAEAMRLVQIGVELLIEKPTVAEMAADIKATERAELVGSPIDGYCLWVYVPRVSGESKTQPATRIPPLRTSSTGPGGNHVRRMLTSVLSARMLAGASDSWEISPGDMFVVCDGGRPDSSLLNLASCFAMFEKQGWK